MSTPLNVLILEDQPADALLALHALRHAGFTPEWRQVMGEEEYRAALGRPPELIIADYSLPQFDALRALDILVDRGLDIPFIIVSGTIDEEMAVSALRRGAADYLLKDRLTRLGMAVRGALQRRQLRAEQQAALAQLATNERRFRALIEHSADGVALVDRYGVLQYVSPAAARITGFPLEVFAGAEALSFVHPCDRADLRELLPGPLALPGTMTLELRLRHRDGTWRWAEVLISNLLDEPAVGALVVNYRDITARKAAEDELRLYAHDLSTLHRMERHARLRAETLRAANLALTRSLSLEAVLEATFGALVRLVPYDRAAMILLQDGVATAAYTASGGAAPTVAPLPLDAVDLEGTPHLQRLLAEGVSLLVDEIAGEAGAAGAWLGVPMHVNGGLIGICTMEAGPELISEEHLGWAEALLAQASLAVTNARLFSEVGQARGRLQLLSHELIRAQESERRGLARELHDEVGQVLIALQLNLRGMRPPRAGTPGAARLADSIGLVDRLIKQVRSLSRDLRPPLLDDLGLAAALSWHLDRVAERAGLDLKLSAPLGDRRLPAELEISVFRIVQEAVNNVVKHARAAHVRVELRRGDGELRVSVTDDGVGFDVDAAETLAAGGSSLGLISMRERALLAGGAVEVISAPEAGTCVRARFSLG